MIEQVILTLSAETPAGGAVPVAMWVTLGAAVAIVGAAVVSVLSRARVRRAALRIARALERWAERTDPDEAPAASPGAPEFMMPIVSSLRRAARTVAARDQAMFARLRDLEAIMHSTTNGFIAIDPQQRVLDMNAAAAAMLGVAQKDVRGRLLPEVARHPALNRFVDEALDRSGANESDLELEGQPPRAVRAAAEPLRDGTGKAIGAIVSMQDVTRLRRLESLRSDFVANVSHELRTPITSIKGYVETLLQIGADDPAQVKRFLDIVHRNTLRLSNLVEDLLSLAALEQDAPEQRGAVQLASVPALTIVNEVREQLQPRADARSIELVCHVEPGLDVFANRILAEQALANLVSNALRYAPEQTRVDIAARALDANEAEFAVSDQGPGISAKHLERIFERFYRVDRSRSRGAKGEGGTGLGLAIVKHIAHAHGGRVDVNSVVGGGSTFRLILRRPPVASAATAPSAA